VFGFEIKNHWIIRFIASIIVVPLSPILLYIASSVYFTLYLYGFDNPREQDYEEKPRYQLRRDILCIGYGSDGPLLTQIILFIILAPIRVAIALICFVVISAVLFIPLALVIVPYYLLLIFLVCNMMWRFCLKSK